MGHSKNGTEAKPRNMGRVGGVECVDLAGNRFVQTMYFDCYGQLTESDWDELPII